MTAIPLDKIEDILQKGKSLEEQLGKENTSEKFVELSKEYSEIQPLYESVVEWKNIYIEISDLKNLLEEESTDKEMKDLASEELEELEKKINSLNDEIKILLLPKDKADSSDVILEIRAGTGGDEAALFAGDLYRMYQRFSDANSWKTEIISISDGDVGGFKEVILSIVGNGVFSKLKFESGVHRVQRVPTTESNGRVHTSAATVAVLPEPEDVDIEIEENKKNIDYIKLQKMAFIFNAIENGWTIKKNGTNYIFSKKHEGRKEIFLDTYLKRFMEENFSLDQIIVK